MISEFCSSSEKWVERRIAYSAAWYTALSTEALPLAISCCPGLEWVLISMAPILQLIRGVGRWRARGFDKVKSGKITSSFPAKKFQHKHWNTRTQSSSLPRPAWMAPVEPIETFRPCPPASTTTGRRAGYCGLIYSSLISLMGRRNILKSPTWNRWVGENIEVKAELK